MRARRRGVFVSIIAVTHGSEKQTTKLKKKQKKNFLRQVRIVLSFFRTDGRDGGRQYANCVRRAINNTGRFGEGLQ
jgi:hypothetical protein